MFSVLLVDDEILELETLRDYVDWNSLGVQVVATARNGKEALEKACKYKPDIIITDIKMPIMDGIEFTKGLRKQNINSKIIFLTGYDDFTYAKNALKVNAIDYILKPVDMNELKDVILKAKKDLEKDKLSAHSLKVFIQNCFYKLLHEDEPSKIVSIISDIKTDSSHDFASFSYYVININSKQKVLNLIENFIYSFDEHAQLIEENCTCTIIIRTDKHHTSSLEEFISFLKYKLDINQCFNASIIYSDFKSTLTELANTFNSLIYARENVFYLGKNSIIKASKNFNKKTTEYSTPSIDKELSSAIFSYDKGIVYKVINEYIKLLTDKKYPKASVIQSVYNLLVFIWDNFLIQNPEISKTHASKNELWEKLSICEDINDVKLIIFDYTEKIVDYLLIKKKDKNQYVVDKIFNFIDKNYHKPITIDDIAKEVYLSSNYIRSIFKEKTGETILEYLTNYRLKKASELLKNKSLKVHDISNMVGYENVSYFCTIFAKKFGASPNDYRKKY
ncbi:response regulator [Clostridium sp. SYSU_GA19001]|uniref:response regulator transcription factor n=1 Tax=Clostridium caldaquaticum TaxID=2940653 RepID=UPI0020770133|nr:response regulator [Clostridium caldaquaticum]MCM8710735.1 response regulator [Clostridium caldaquaticum]